MYFPSCFIQFLHHFYKLVCSHVSIKIFFLQEFVDILIFVPFFDIRHIMTGVERTRMNHHTVQRVPNVLFMMFVAEAPRTTVRRQIKKLLELYHVGALLISRLLHFESLQVYNQNNWWIEDQGLLCCRGEFVVFG